MTPWTGRIFLLGVCFGILLYITFFVINNDSTQMENNYIVEIQKPEAFPSRRNGPDVLRTLLTAGDPDTPREGKAIFFHETSPFHEEGISLTPRQACAVESAAKMNPSMKIFLLVLNHSKISKKTRQFVDLLSTYENIKIRRIFMEDYVANTMLEKWWSSEIVNKSNWPVHHMSDILRYLTLYKFGGTYLDLDVIVMKSLEKLTNFVGAEDGGNLAAGAIGFGLDDLGRTIADACLTELKTTFRGDVWGQNGPGVVTRTLKKLCHAEDISNMTKENCRGFTVYPPSAFYPLHYSEWSLYFKEQSINSTMARIKDSFAIHAWNKLSNKELIPAGRQVPYAIVAREFCPKIYQNSGEFF
ncbi:lactosylceramide 4-alpha-galactosyltransferase-like [Diachasmimorpha longicaudata]|uniref:lactosylceramide 4-alpha-galactosyltransferase-like n=1 Tax=Diachasmimorpha longicaudata TaxID=58733 RepID=UPI0030B88EEC